MERRPLAPIGKTIRRRLDDLNQTNGWLIEKVKMDTGLYFDDGYLYRITRGQNKSPKIIASICKILDIDIREKEEK